MNHLHSTAAAQLNAQACAVLRIPDVDPADFKQKIDTAAKAWFTARLARAISITTTPQMKDPAKMQEWELGRRQFVNLDNKLMRSTVRQFDPTTYIGQKNLFDPATRRRALAPLARAAGLPAASYLLDRICYVLYGDCRMALGNMHKAWLKNGFGMWAHIHPELALVVAMAVADALREEGFRVSVDTTPGHLIYKPAGGESLAPHSDGPCPSTIIAELEAHVASSDPSAAAFAQKKGMQSLYHISGGIDDGSTYCLNASPEQYLFCLKAIRANADPARFDFATCLVKKNSIEEWAANAGGGPAFFNWHRALPRLNSLMAEAGVATAPVEFVSIRPAGPGQNGFTALWPLGWVHGSNANDSPRLSLTTPLLFGSAAGKENRNTWALDLLDDLATAANEEADEERRAAAAQRIAKNKRPLHGGLTHKNPGHKAQWILPDSGHFHSIAATEATAKRFRAAGI